VKREANRLLVPPLGWPFKFKAYTVTPADKPAWITFNRYPRQTIGIVLRLPDEFPLGGRVSHKALSLLWSSPARWWKR
jgi:hypothetical protein